MDVLRRSAGIYRVDRERNEYIRGKLDVQDTVLGGITGKKLILCGHVEGR
jgi:hypothetical protein